MEYNFIFSFSKRSKKGDKNGKGLRHFSMKVCEKVQRKGTTSYNEVADELVSEFTNSNNHLAADSVGRPRLGVDAAALYLSGLSLSNPGLRRVSYWGILFWFFCCFVLKRILTYLNIKGGKVFLKHLWGLLKKHTF